MSRQSFAFLKSVSLELTIPLSIFIEHSHFFEAVKRVYQNKRIASYSDPVNDPKLIKENDRESTIEKCTKKIKKATECLWNVLHEARVCEGVHYSSVEMTSISRRNISSLGVK